MQKQLLVQRISFFSRTVWSRCCSSSYCTKMKFSIKDFSSKRDQIHSLWRIWSHLLEISLMENSVFYAVSQSHYTDMKGYYFGYLQSVSAAAVCYAGKSYQIL